jgi:hypothetical protein
MMVDDRFTDIDFFAFQASDGAMPVPKWLHSFAVFFSAVSLRAYATIIAWSNHRSILSTVLFCHRSWINRDTKIHCCFGKPKQA